MRPAFAAPYAECRGAEVMPETEATNTMTPPPARAQRAASELHRVVGVAQDDVEVPVPVVVGEVDEVRVPGHPHDVDDAVEPAECALRLREQALGVAPHRCVTRARDAADLSRDLGGQVGVDVDAEHRRAEGRERVRRLTADPVARTHHHEAAAVETQPPRVVGDRAVVGAGHEPEAAAATVTLTSSSRLRSSGMTSRPRSTRFVMIDSCDSCPNCT